MSITIVRNGVVFAYVGCVVSQFKYSQSDGILTATYSIVGADELDGKTLPTDAWSAEDVYGPGEYTVELPTGSTVTDTQSFDLTVNDNASAQFRLKSTGRNADFIQYGARTVELETKRDFLSKAVYADFKALTAESVSLSVSHGANNSIGFVFGNVAQDTHEVSLSGQGDIIASSIKYNAMIDDNGVEYVLTINTQEDLGRI
jgi:hypothetical protein